MVLMQLASSPNLSIHPISLAEWWGGSGILRWDLGVLNALLELSCSHPNQRFLSFPLGGVKPGTQPEGRRQKTCWRGGAPPWG